MIRFLAGFGVLCILAGQCFAEDDLSKWAVGRLTLPMTIKPATSLSISDGARTAVIDFGGPTVTFSGDLPMDQSAKLFFEYVMKFRSEWCAPSSSTAN